MTSLHKRLTVFLTCLLAALLPVAPVCAENAERMLLNGSFEMTDKDKKFTFTDKYKIQNAGVVWAWNTTASDNQIEIFQNNQNVYLKNELSAVTLKASDGTYAAELNANQESTLYQVVSTEPLSLYEWGLDHGSRTALDTMALIIGPNQPVAPAKSDSKDQFMRMVDWLGEEGNPLSSGFEKGIQNGGAPVVVYSAKFAENGSFTAPDDPFSLTPSETHTEKWYIWVMSDQCAKAGDEFNPWGHYGTNDTSLTDAQRILYRYPVPSGQKETIFAFVSVQSAKGDKSYGNFLDGINFKLYHPLHGSTTPNGSADVTESDGKGSFSGDISATQDLSAYIPDDSSYTIQATIAEADKATVTFAGVYYTVPDGQGGSKTTFISSEDAGFVKSGSETGPGDIDYTYELKNVRTSVSLHFVFIKSPEITFDANGGIPYACPNGSNYYDFAPQIKDGQMTYIPPYTFGNAVGYEGWRFCGWQLNDDAGPRTDLGLLTERYAVACNYVNSQDGLPVKRQNFVVLKAGLSFRGSTQDDNGVVWLRGEKDALYDDVATGLTMVAQWKWRQSFIPETRTQSLAYAPSNEGGDVTVVTGSENGENGAKIRYADEGEIITAEASAHPGYRFDGWYDAGDNLVTLSTTLTYREDMRQVNTYYARFTRIFTQTYARQLPSDEGWVTLAPEAFADDLTISSTLVTGSYGMPAGSEAGCSDAYTLAGWFDAGGAAVPQDMLAAGNPAALDYAIREDADYFARFLPKGIAELAYDANGGTGSMPSRFGPGNSSVQVEKSGFTAPSGDHRFIGWNTRPDGTGDAYRAGDVIALTAERTVLYAQWEEKLRLSYDANGGFGSMPDSACYAGESVTLADNGFTAPSGDHRFIGWNTRPDGTGDAYRAGDVIALTAERTVLYAQWEEKLRLTYDANGGFGSMPDSACYAGESVTLADNGFTAPSGDHRFIGWNTKPDGTGDAYRSGDAIALTAERIVLYAQWEEVRLEDADLPQTGDASRLGLWCLLAAAAAGALARLARIRRRG